MYSITDEEIQAQQAEYKKNYPPFYPFSLKDMDRWHIMRCFEVLLSTQNGQDTDDYCVDDANNKVRKYFGEAEKDSNRMLLLGTGTGREILTAKDLGYDAVGNTFGSRNVYFGRHYLGLSETEIFECAMESLPFEANTFDKIGGFQVFEHAMMPLQFLLEQSRVLKDGGILVLEWPPAKDYHGDDNPHHQICFTPGQAKMLFKKAGFVDIKLFYSDLEEIPEEDYWRADQNKMLCISGIKDPSFQPYINAIRNSR